MRFAILFGFTEVSKGLGTHFNEDMATILVTVLLAFLVMDLVEFGFKIARSV